jgi:hypothetical protein
MYLMFADETNVDPTERVQFFIYGGLVVPMESAEPLTTAIGQVRSDKAFRLHDSLKYQGSTRPRHIERDTWNEAKSAVIEACRNHNVQFIACLVHHKIAERQREHLIDWQLNSLLNVFSHQFLTGLEDYGVVLIDRIGRGQEYPLMREKFTRGGETPWGTRKTFPRIVAYGSTCDNASHLASAADIVLGTLAYCVNQQGDLTRPRELFPKIDPLIWRRRSGGKAVVWSHGLILNPAQVKAQRYKDDYERLKRHIRTISPG